MNVHHSDQPTSHDLSQQRPVPRENLVPDLNGVNAFDADKVATDVLARHAPWAR